MQWSLKQSAFKAASSLHLTEWLPLSGRQPTTPDTHRRSQSHPHSSEHTEHKTPVLLNAQELAARVSATPPCAVILELDLFKIRSYKIQPQPEPLNGCCGCWGCICGSEPGNTPGPLVLHHPDLLEKELPKWCFILFWCKCGELNGVGEIDWTTAIIRINGRGESRKLKELTQHL